MTPPRPRLIALKRAATEVGVPYTTLRDVALRGELPFIRIGRALYLEWADIERWIAEPERDGRVSPWVRYDDGFYDDPRVIGVSLAAIGLLHISLVWSSRHLTDGWVSRVTALQRAGDTYDSIARELTDANLWTASEREGRPGFQLAAFLVELQPTRAQVQQQREHARDRQRRSRTRSVTSQSQRDGSVSHAPVTTPRPVPSRPLPDKSTDAIAPVPSIREKDIATHAQLCVVYADVLRTESGCSTDRKAAFMEALVAENLAADPGDPDAIRKAMDAVEFTRRAVVGATRGNGFEHVADRRATA